MNPVFVLLKIKNQIDVFIHNSYLIIWQIKFCDNIRNYITLLSIIIVYNLFDYSLYPNYMWVSVFN